MASLTATQRPAAAGGAQVDIVAGAQQLVVSTNTADVDVVDAATVAGGTALTIRLSDSVPGTISVNIDMLVTPAQTMHGTIVMKGLGKGKGKLAPPAAPPAGPYGRGGQGGGVNGRGGKGRDRGGP
jgi:hypothetical protein